MDCRMFLQGMSKSVCGSQLRIERFVRKCLGMGLCIYYVNTPCLVSSRCFGRILDDSLNTGRLGILADKCRYRPGIVHLDRMVMDYTGLMPREVGLLNRLVYQKSKLLRKYVPGGLG